jgi:hypothetical protein
MAAQLDWYPDQTTFVRHGSKQDLCRVCFEPASRMVQRLGLRLRRYGEFIEAEEKTRAETLAASVPIASIRAYEEHGIAVGEHAWAGALRFYARGDLAGEPQGEAVLRRFFAAALLATAALRRLFATNRYDVAAFHHGIYVPQGVVRDAATQARVRVVNWNPAYRSGCFIFSHGETYHHALMGEPTASWESMAWDDDTSRHVLDYLASRFTGQRDWISFQDPNAVTSAKAADSIALDPAKPIIGLLTNVVWDAQLHYPANAFSSMAEWLVKTIRWFAGRPDLQLLVRVHPAEVKGAIPSRQRVVDLLAEQFSALPPHVVVVPPENPASTYRLMDRCNAVLIYGTKSGVELTSMGIPVIVAGEAWIRGKGVTIDASSEEDYFRILERLPLAGRLPPEQVERARRYAFHFFFRRMIELGPVEGQAGWPPFRLNITGLDDLRPGRHAGLDVVCRGILEDTPFVFEAERGLVRQRQSA